MKVISTGVHGALDYLMAVALFAVPRLLGWSEPVTLFMSLMAVLTLLYSLITRYEMGVTRSLPMEMHLALDFFSGMVFLAAAVAMRTEPAPVRWVLGIIGLFEIGASLLTDPQPSPAIAGPEERLPRTR